jgi:hypothetical protein
VKLSTVHPPGRVVALAGALNRHSGKAMESDLTYR